MAPVFGRLGKRYKGTIAFIAVNVYDRPEMGKRFGVTATPTFVLVRKGKALRRFYGNIPEPLLSRHLAPYAPPAPAAQDDVASKSFLSGLLRIFHRN